MFFRTFVISVAIIFVMFCKTQNMASFIISECIEIINLSLHTFFLALTIDVQF
jgi:hypothetical protein